MQFQGYKVSLFALLMSCSPGLYALHLPLWEAGVGASTLRIPAYRGSPSVVYYAVPFPYFIYRGEVVRVDGEGVSGRVFDRDNIRLDLSLGGNVPVRREQNGLRAGMPGLDPVVEAGPTLNIRLSEKGAQNDYWGLHFPLRPVFSAANRHLFPEPAYRGWVLAPHVEWQTLWRSRSGLFGFKSSLGALYGDARYHEYFYDVAPAYATATRPAYQATAGYSGTRFTGMLSYYATPHLSFTLYVRYDELSGATFEHSPIVTDRHYAMVALTAIWVFWFSEHHVEHL
ncbi:MAG: MipA/OmpV family protein [Gammaproteobacteria bacterium]|nr:MipA/OmpV family protein [Gammaproteobacteria bacterium]